MIVECPQCSTKFRLDDSKITSKGVKVRCSKCKHIFTAMKPGSEAAASPPPTDAPSPAPPPLEPSAPPPSEPPDSDFDDESFDFKDETPAPQPSAAPDEFDNGLGDLSFKEEAEEPGDQEAAPSDDLDFGDFSFDQEESGPETDQQTDQGADQETAPVPSSDAAGFDDDFGDFDFDDESSTPPAAEPQEQDSPPEQKSAVGADDEFDFDDFSDFSDESAVKKEPAAEIGADDFSGDFGGDDLDFDTGSAPEPSPELPSAPPSEEDIQEFGDISFDDAGAPPPPAEETPAPGGAEEGEFQLDTNIGGTSAEEFQEPVAGGDAYAFDAGGGEVPESEIPVPQRPDEGYEEPAPREMPRSRSERRAKPAKEKKSKKGLVVIIIIALIGGGIFYLHTTGHLKNIMETSLKDLNMEKFKELLGVAEEKPPQNIIEIAPVKRTDLRRVTRKDKSTIWVLKGSVANHYGTSQWMILLEGRLEDGDEVRTAQAMYGNELTNEQLQVLSLEQIEKLLMRTADDNLNSIILLPEGSTQFMLVFTDVESSSPKLPPVDAVIVKSHEAL